MLTKFYFNNEDGTFEFLFDMECDIYYRPYNGDRVNNWFNISFVYETKINEGVLYCYTCDINSDLLNGVEKLMVEILDHPTLKIRYMAPEKYMEGKKCKLEDGTTYIMGKILKRTSVKEMFKLYPDVLTGSGNGSTCMI